LIFEEYTVTSSLPATSSARDRLLLATANLLVESGNRTASTRAICELAGVQAPTLYHYFGSKQGLIDAVINHGFTQYVTPGHEANVTDDPLVDLRAGWDRHVQFGLEHPTFYALLYGAVIPGQPCAIAAPAKAMLLELLDRAARHGLLRVSPSVAAAEIFAANVGVTLQLITQPDTERDIELSARVREAILASLVTESIATDTDATNPSPAREAIALAAMLDQTTANLSTGELAILRELLDRISAS
jgi:AcrR family transcriptional regulator